MPHGATSQAFFIGSTDVIPTSSLLQGGSFSGGSGRRSASSGLRPPGSSLEALYEQSVEPGDARGVARPALEAMREGNDEDVGWTPRAAPEAPAAPPADDLDCTLALDAPGPPLTDDLDTCQPRLSVESASLPGAPAGGVSWDGQAAEVGASDTVETEEEAMAREALAESLAMLEALKAEGALPEEAPDADKETDEEARAREELAESLAMLEALKAGGALPEEAPNADKETDEEVEAREALAEALAMLEALKAGGAPPEEEEAEEAEREPEVGCGEPVEGSAPVRMPPTSGCSAPQESAHTYSKDFEAPCGEAPASSASLFWASQGSFHASGRFAATPDPAAKVDPFLGSWKETMGCRVAEPESDLDQSILLGTLDETRPSMPPGATRPSMPPGAALPTLDESGGFGAPFLGGEPDETRPSLELGAVPPKLGEGGAPGSALAVGELDETRPSPPDSMADSGPLRPPCTWSEPGGAGAAPPTESSGLAEIPGSGGSAAPSWPSLPGTEAQPPAEGERFSIEATWPSLPGTEIQPPPAGAAEAAPTWPTLPGTEDAAAGPGAARGPSLPKPFPESSASYFRPQMRPPTGSVEPGGYRAANIPFAEPVAAAVKRKMTGREEELQALRDKTEAIMGGAVTRLPELRHLVQEASALQELIITETLLAPRLPDTKTMFLHIMRVQERA